MCCLRSCTKGLKTKVGCQTRMHIYSLRGLTWLQLYNTDLKKPIRSCDVVFKVDEFLETTENENFGSEQDLEW